MTSRRYSPCILATCVIPWNEDWSLAVEMFRREIQTLLVNLTRDLYVFGTAGEGYAVTDRQFDEVLRVFREETNLPDVRAMVGVISLSLPVMIERIERASEMGFRYFQISLPSWGALNDRELREFFKETCGRFPDASFLHYNLMRTKRLVTPEEYALLANEHPNLVAAKNSTDDTARISGLMAKAPQLQHFFTETGYGLGSQIGECGLLISIASIHFVQARKYFQAGQSGDRVELVARQRELLELTQDLLALGRSQAHMDGAYDKVFAKIHDPDFPLRLLPPYAGLTDDTFQQFIALLREKFPRWAMVNQ